jgi:3D-(3,5/4)-trihydroxycyclohexane-1,2-dione acylhydrolase (decyclizing)
LQRACGSASFNNLFPGGSGVDFAAHAVSLGADACKAVSLAELESALPKMRAAQRTSVAVIATDPALSTSVGGAWWDVAIPEVSNRPQVVAARAAYDAVRERRATQD